MRVLVNILIVLAIIGVLVFWNVFPWSTNFADALYTNATLPYLNEAAISWTFLPISPAIIIGAALILTLFTRQRWRIWGIALVFAAMMFPLTYGLGYRITPLEERLELVSEPAAPLELATFAINAGEAAEQDNATHSARSERAGQCVGEFLVATELFPDWRAPSIRSVPGGWLIRFGVSGFINPFTHEPHVDGAMPGWYYEQVARHEHAHTAGFSREAEAEAVAILSGLLCSDQQAQYTASVALSMWMMNHSPEVMRLDLPDRVYQDISELHGQLREQTNEQLSDITGAVYTRYLQSQGEAGTTEYARATSIVARALNTGLCELIQGCD